jgi:hypothetical protein
MFVRRALVCWFCSYKFGANKGRAFHKSTPIGDMTKKKTGSSKYYAVARGRRTGIFRSWEECSEQVGFSSLVWFVRCVVIILLALIAPLTPPKNLSVGSWARSQ